MANPTSDVASAPPPPLLEVVFDESESVTQFGTKSVTFRVLANRVWVSPNQLPNARTQMLPKSPATLWRRLVLAHLPIGTTVEKRVVQPQRHAASSADVLLGKAPGQRLHTARTTLHVGPRGALIP